MLGRDTNRNGPDAQDSKTSKHGNGLIPDNWRSISRPQGFLVASAIWIVASSSDSTIGL